MKGDKYLMIYRCFVPDIKYLNRRNMDSAHVWESSWDFALEEPIVSLVSITKNNNGKVKINTLKELEIKGGDLLSVILNYSRVEDCRIWKFNKKIFISGSILNWYGDEGVNKMMLEKLFDKDTEMRRCWKNFRKCDNVLQFVGELDITTPSKFLNSKHVHLKNMTFPCLNNQLTYNPSSLGIYEKNWSYWNKGNQLFMSYSVTPHTIFKIFDKQMLKTGEDSIKNTRCKKLYTTKCALDTVKTYKNKKISFRLGSPSIKLNKDEFLSIGHSVLSSKKIPQTPGRKRSLGKVYLMFVYTFDAKPPHQDKKGD